MRLCHFFFVAGTLILYEYLTVTIVSQKYRELFWFPKQYLFGFFILEKQHANIPDRGFLFLRNTLLFYFLSPYSQTKWLTEKWIRLLRVGWRNLFSSCAVVSFFVLAGNRFWFYILLMYLEYNTYNCGVVFVFWFWQEIVINVTYVLSVQYQYSCVVVSVFWLWR